MFRPIRSWLPAWLVPARRRPIRRPVRLTVDRFEDRTVPAAFTVTTVDDPSPLSLSQIDSATGVITDAASPDYGQVTLRSALLAANATAGSDTIGFSRGDNGTTNFYDGAVHKIALSSALPTITDSVSITGVSAADTVIDAINPVNNAPVGRVFTIDDSSAALTVAFQSLTMENGSGDGKGGGVLFTAQAYPGDALTIQDCVVTGNSAEGVDAYGGGIMFYGAANSGDMLTITNSAVSDNAAYAGTDSSGVGGKAYGGGVAAIGVGVTVTNGTLSDNLAQGGTSLEPSSALKQAAALGGGLYADAGSLTVTNTLITGNTARGGSTPDVGDFSGGVGGAAFGGGVYMTDTTATVTNSILSDNEALAGVTLVTPYDAHTAVAYGGGLAAEGAATLTVTASTISHNTAQGGNVEVSGEPVGAFQYAGAADGGGLYFDAQLGNGTGLFNMTDTEVDWNQATGGGIGDGIDDQETATGGAAFGGGMDVLTTDQSGVTAGGVARNSTFYHNTAQGGSVTINNINLNGHTEGGAFGGAAFTGGVSVSQLINSTVYYNMAIGGDATATVEPTEAEPEGFPDVGDAKAGLAGGGGYGPSHTQDFFDTIGVTYTIANSTIVGNTATAGVENRGLTDAAGHPFEFDPAMAFGGGVDDGTPTTHTGPVGQYMDNRANVVLSSTIVAKNTATWTAVAAGPDIVGGDTAGHDGHNLIGQSDASAPNFPQSVGGTSGLPAPNGNNDLVGPVSSVPLDPGLGGFGQHGGLTQTLVPTADGLALDNGQAGGLTTDQRDAPFVRTYDLTGGNAVNYADGTDVGAVELQAVQVVSVVVNQGAAQRSMVTNIEVTFSGQVSFDPGAFTLTRVGLPNGVAGDNATLTSDPSAAGVITVTQSNGFTVATLTFSGANESFGSLDDGNWTLRIDHTKVHAGGSDGLDMAADYTQTDITRLYGDINGDRYINLFDLGAFRTAIGATAGDPEYVAAFDYNADGYINLIDLGQFRYRIGASV